MRLVIIMTVLVLVLAGSLGYLMLTNPFDKGLKAFENKNYAGAIEYFTRSIDSGSGTAKAFYYRGKAYHLSGQSKLALRDLDRAIALDKFYQPPVAYRAYVNIGLGHYAKAKEDGDLAVKLNRLDVDAYVYKSIANYHTKDYKIALEAMNKALTMEKKTDKAAAFLYYGHILRKDPSFGSENQKLWKMTLHYYEKALKRKPGYTEAHYALGNTYAKDKKQFRPKAIEHYTRAIKLEPRHAAAYLGRGRLHVANQEIKPAIADLEKALELNPGLGEARRLLASVYCDIGQCEKGIALMNQALETETDDSFMDYALRADLYTKTGQLEKADSDFSTSLEIQPGAGITYFWRAKLRLKQGRFKEGLNDIRMASVDHFRKPAVRASKSKLARIIGFSGKEFSDSRLARGRLLLATGKDMAAFTYIKHATNIWKGRDKPEAHFLLGLFFYNYRAFKMAESQFNMSIRQGNRGIDVQIMKFMAGARKKKSTTATFKLSPQPPVFEKDRKYQPMADMFTGKITPQACITAGSGSGAEIKRHRCRAYYYAGQFFLLQGNKRAARSMFRKSVAVNSPGCDELIGARSELDESGTRQRDRIGIIIKTLVKVKKIAVTRGKKPKILTIELVKFLDLDKRWLKAEVKKSIQDALAAVFDERFADVVHIVPTPRDLNSFTVRNYYAVSEANFREFTDGKRSWEKLLEKRPIDEILVKKKQGSNR